MFWLWLACTGTAPVAPDLPVERVVSKVRPGTADASAWGAAVHAALIEAEVRVDVSTVCQVLAVIEQESGYQENPPVPRISEMVEARLLEQLSRLGPFDEAALQAVLELKIDGSGRTLAEQLAEARTERDLDRLYRAILDHLKVGPIGRTLAPGWVDRANPVSTLGSMQVQLAYARDQRSSKGLSRVELREQLYTLPGGVRYGTLRLFDTDPDYADPIFRFADFNAGPYASRNAAFQRQLQTLTGESLVSDGDLLIYNARGKPTRAQEGETVRVLTQWAERTQAALGPGQILADLRQEKTAAFTETETWRAVRAAFAAKLGRQPAHAILPAVTLDSPKLQGNWTTANFAERVDRRYHDCLKR